MKITAIKQQVKRKDRYSIYIDEVYRFSLSEAELLTQGISVGKEYDQEDLDRLLTDAVVDKARYRALDLLSRRPRSSWEIADYLKRKDYTEEIIARVVGQLSEYGYLDDEDFARRWVETRMLLKPSSTRKLRQELRQKRVADEIIDAVFLELDSDEVAIVRELIERKNLHRKYPDKQKLMQYLARQGFGYDTIKAALSSD